MDLRDLRTAVPFEKTFDTRLGTVYEQVEPERVSGYIDVREELLGRDGSVALGVYASIAESAASLGTMVGVFAKGMAASGMSNDTGVSVQVRAGRISFVAERRSATPDLWSWSIEACDEEGRVCALSRVLIAVRPVRVSS